jgi:hypothetical protein
MLSVGLLAKLAGSGVPRADEPLSEASIEMAEKRAPGRRLGHGVNAGAGVRHQVTGFGGRLPGLPHARLGRPGRCPCGVLPTGGVIGDVGAIRAG